MPRCGCSGSSCSCSVVSGPGVTVTGVGSADRPYSISAAPLYQEWIGPGASYYLEPDGNPNSVFYVDSTNMDIYITLPGSPSGAQLPPPGSRIDIFVNGSSGMNVNFAGLFNLFVAPGAEKRGWYSFVLIQGAWMGRFVASP